MQKFYKDMFSGIDTLLNLTEDDIAVDQLEKETVFTIGKMKLKHYKPLVKKAKVRPVPLLITYALVNRQYMLDLQEDRSFIKGLLTAGNDVYVIDWGYPTAEDRYMSMDDYINWYMDECVDYILRESSNEKLNLMGICQGGTFSAIYTALNPEKIKNLITLVTPIDFSTNEGLLFRWGKDMNIDSLVDTFGVVPGDIMNYAYLILKPYTLSMDKYLKMLAKMKDPEFLKNYMRMERWSFDSPAQAGETLRQFVNDLYKENKLVKGQLVVGNKKVNLKNIKCPVLMACGDSDHLVPTSASCEFSKFIGSKDATYMHFATGHIGMFTSSKSQKEVLPSIVDWLACR